MYLEDLHPWCLSNTFPLTSTTGKLIMLLISLFINRTFSLTSAVAHWPDCSLLDPFSFLFPFSPSIIFPSYRKVLVRGREVHNTLKWPGNYRCDDGFLPLELERRCCQDRAAWFYPFLLEQRAITWGVPRRFVVCSSDAVQAQHLTHVFYSDQIFSKSHQYQESVYNGTRGLVLNELYH